MKNPSELATSVREAFLYVAPIHDSVVGDASAALAELEARADTYREALREIQQTSMADRDEALMVFVGRVLDSPQHRNAPAEEQPTFVCPACGVSFKVASWQSGRIYCGAECSKVLDVVLAGPPEQPEEPS